MCKYLFDRHTLGGIHKTPCGYVYGGEYARNGGETMNTQRINFYEKYMELGRGVLFDYPIAESAILAHNITEEEMMPFMDSKCAEYNAFRGKHWFYILDEILWRRENKS